MRVIFKTFLTSSQIEEIERGFCLYIYVYILHCAIQMVAYVTVDLIVDSPVTKTQYL